MLKVDKDVIKKACSLVMSLDDVTGFEVKLDFRAATSLPGYTRDTIIVRFSDSEFEIYRYNISEKDFVLQNRNGLM